MGVQQVQYPPPPRLCDHLASETSGGTRLLALVIFAELRSKAQGLDETLSQNPWSFQSLYRFFLV